MEIAGGSVVVIPASRGVLAFVRKAAKKSRRVASICTGAFVLAAAGLLEGRRATTHWCVARELQARYPNVKVDEDRIFVVDAPIWTSAGASAGVDLALAMIEEDLGDDMAHLVAKKLVLLPSSRRRAVAALRSVLEMNAGEHGQNSERVDVCEAKPSRVAVPSSSWPGLPTSAHANLAVHSTRRPAIYPAKAIESLRVESARVMMEQRRDSIIDVAREK